MIKKNQKLIWLIGLVLVPIVTMFSCLYYAYQEMKNVASDDRIGLILGACLFLLMSLTWVVAELEVFLSVRFFLFRNTGVNNFKLIKIHKTRLIVSSIFLAVTVEIGVLLMVGMSDGEMLLSLCLFYWFFFFVVKILHLVLWLTFQYKST